jgi:protein-S-isoprenylcysteine O-methyltransferase Ste14
MKGTKTKKNKPNWTTMALIIALLLNLGVVVLSVLERSWLGATGCILAATGISLIIWTRVSKGAENERH